MATSNIVDHSIKKKFPDYGPKRQVTWTSISWYTFKGFLATVVTMLHLVRPDLDFGEGTSVFLWPFSPIRIASLFSIFHTVLIQALFITPFDKETDSFHWISEAELKQIFRDSFNTPEINSYIFISCLSALTLVTDILRTYFAFLSLSYGRMPFYQPGEILNELQWAYTLFIWALFGAGFLVPCAALWNMTARLFICRAKANSLPSTNTASPRDSCTTGSITPSPPMSLDHNDRLPHTKTGILTPLAPSQELETPSKASTLTPPAPSQEPEPPRTRDHDKAALHDWTVIGAGPKEDTILHKSDVFSASLASMHRQLEDTPEPVDEKNWLEECHSRLDAIETSAAELLKLQKSLTETSKGEGN